MSDDQRVLTPQQTYPNGPMAARGHGDAMDPNPDVWMDRLALVIIVFGLVSTVVVAIALILGFVVVVIHVAAEVLRSWKTPL